MAALRLEAARRLRAEASLYAGTAARVFQRRVGEAWRGRVDERLVFVVGSPRSGTTFVARSLGAQPGFVDLGEVKPLKAAVAELAALPPAQAERRIRRMLDGVRRLAFVRRLRCVEQTPETGFVLPAALAAYPEAKAVHVLRDGRDVVCSLLERGWLGSERAGGDDARLPYGAHARFWVEAERLHEFPQASEAGRAAWAWRRYVTAARSVPERTFELRYEQLVSDPAAAAERVAAFLDVSPGPLVEQFSAARPESVGRWRRELSADQLADVEREAGPLLRELGYL